MPKKKQTRQHSKKSNAAPSTHTEPLYSLNSERSVLGGILLENSVMDRVIDIVQPNDFFTNGHRRLYELLIDMHAHGQAMDYLTVGDRIRAAGESEIMGDDNYLSQLTDTTPTLANIEDYAKRVADYALVRRVKVAGLEAYYQPFSQYDDVAEFVAEVESNMLNTLTHGQQRRVMNLKEVMVAAIQELERQSEARENQTNLKTGYRALDSRVRMDRGDLIFLAARPAMGKSALALPIVKNACLPGKAAMLFSLEMSTESLGARLLADEASIDLGRLRNATLGDYDWTKLANAAQQLSKIDLYIDDTPNLRMVEIRSRVRRLEAELQRSGKSLGIVAIDYLQLCRPDNTWDMREREIADISRSLKALAREMKIPVLALSQLNRKVEQRENKRPKLADLRESGAMEQDADVILFIYRDEYYHENSPDKGVAEIIIGKQRNGPTGVVKLRFLPEFTRFEDLENSYD